MTRCRRSATPPRRRRWRRWPTKIPHTYSPLANEAVVRTPLEIAAPAGAATPPDDGGYRADVDGLRAAAVAAVVAFHVVPGRLRGRRRVLRHLRLRRRRVRRPEAAEGPWCSSRRILRVARGPPRAGAGRRDGRRRGRARRRREGRAAARRVFQHGSPGPGGRRERLFALSSGARRETRGRGDGRRHRRRGRLLHGLRRRGPRAAPPRPQPLHAHVVPRAGGSGRSSFSSSRPRRTRRRTKRRWPSTSCRRASGSSARACSRGTRSSRRATAATRFWRPSTARARSSTRPQGCSS